MQAKILIIEDECEMAELIKMYLEKDGCATTACGSAEEALPQINETFDLILLDINLPGMDGFEYLHSLRKTNNTPVIIISARDCDEDMVMGFGIGADEYISKPFSPKVLVARIRALLRRQRENLLIHKIVSFGPFSLEPESYLLKKSGNKIPLSIKEFEVLNYLVSNAGKALTPENIFETLWENRFGDLTTIAVYIQRLRKKIEDNPASPYYIQTVHGKGYCFNREALT